MIKKYHSKVCKNYLKKWTDRERGFAGCSRARRMKQYLKAFWMSIHFGGNLKDVWMPHLGEILIRRAMAHEK